MKSFREFIRDFDKKRLGASVRSGSIDTTATERLKQEAGLYYPSPQKSGGQVVPETLHYVDMGHPEIAKPVPPDIRQIWGISGSENAKPPHLWFAHHPKKLEVHSSVPHPDADTTMAQQRWGYMHSDLPGFRVTNGDDIKIPQYQGRVDHNRRLITYATNGYVGNDHEDNLAVLSAQLSKQFPGYSHRDVNNHNKAIPVSESNYFRLVSRKC